MTEPEFTLSCDRYGTVCSEPCGKCLVSEIDALRAQLKAVEAERDRMAEENERLHASISEISGWWDSRGKEILHLQRRIEKLKNINRGLRKAGEESKKVCRWEVSGKIFGYTEWATDCKGDEVTCEAVPSFCPSCGKRVEVSDE